MATAARHGRDGRLARWREGFRHAARRSGRLVGGLALSLGAVFALLALISYHPSDPALNTEAGGPVDNWMGSAGAWASDILLMLMGPPGAPPGGAPGASAPPGAGAPPAAGAAPEGEGVPGAPAGNSQ